MPAVPASPALPPAAGSGRFSPADLEIIKTMIRDGRKSAIDSVRAVARNPKIQVRFSETRIQKYARLKSAVHSQFASSGSGAHAYFVHLEQELQGNLVLVITEENLNRLAHMMFAPDEFPGPAPGPESISAVREITNLVSVAFTNAMSRVTGVRIMPSAPTHAADYREVFDRHLANRMRDDDMTLVIETEFQSGDYESLFYFYILPGSGGFETLLRLSRAGAL